MELNAVKFANFVISNRSISFFIDEQNSPGHCCRSKNHAESDCVTSLILISMVTELEKNPHEIVEFSQ